MRDRWVLRYRVMCGKKRAAFNNYRDAMRYARDLSDEVPGHLVEVSAPDGLVGQYQDGRSTPEFMQHHVAMILS